MSELRVLLVDDHPVVREGLRGLLDRQPNMQVVGEAHDGAMACAMAGELQPDVVIMDVTMPQMNGIEATRALKRGFPHVRVLALTIHEDRSYVRQLLEAGASGYVLKRSAPEELVRAVEIVATGAMYLDAGVAAIMGATLVRDESEGREGAVPLSNREAEVLKLIAQGLSNKEIAAHLDLSIKTVETYKSRSMEKLGLTGRADIVRFAIRKGWLQDADPTDEVSGKP